MSRKPNYFKSFLKIMEELHRDYPDYETGRHLSTALMDYGDSWGMSDKELVYALQKYKSTLELDYQTASDDYVNKIIKDAEDLDHILDDEEDYEDI